MYDQIGHNSNIGLVGVVFPVPLHPCAVVVPLVPLAKEDSQMRWEVSRQVAGMLMSREDWKEVSFRNF